MSAPIELDLPHKLGKEEARRRLADNVHRLTDHIPGGGSVQSGWTGDRLDLTVSAMGEQVHAAMDVGEDKVHVRFTLPGMLGMFSGIIAGALKAKGGMLLEDHRKG